VDSFKAKKSLKVGAQDYEIFSLQQASQNGLTHLDKLPKSLKVLAENLLRKEDGKTIKAEDIQAINDWAISKSSKHEIAFYPSRIMLQDFTGVPAVVDLAAMRDAMEELGGDPAKINPQIPVDLVIDHSVMVDSYGQKDSFSKNVEIEFERNNERYEVLKWAQSAFQNFKVVPPGTGIIHQVNLEYTAKVVWTQGKQAYFDSLVGTDSHTTMINGLSVLGWGVGGIEAEAAMLGQPLTMVIPEVVGFKLTGELKEGTTATDLVLRVVELLRSEGVVGKFVEFYGDGLDHLTLADRATISNMAPEYGATVGFFPIDQEVLNYLVFTGRPAENISLVEAYAKEQGLWREHGDEPSFSKVLELDMNSVGPSIAGPKRPQDRMNLSEAATNFKKSLLDTYKISEKNLEVKASVKNQDYSLSHGDVVIAAITSCTNTSNPAVMIAAGLVAKKAHELGLNVKPWVKTSLAPGSKVVTDYLVESGLQTYLNDLGFNLVGYGCTTCIGNSGPLNPEISEAINDQKLVAASVLSGNRNFEGRISPDAKANYLMSPPLVVAYAIAGSMKIDITKDSLGKSSTGKDIYLKDIWPSNAEIQTTIKNILSPEMFKKRYSNVFEGTQSWKNINAVKSKTYAWNSASTYIQNPPFFTNIKQTKSDKEDIIKAQILAILPDSTTTDHISPAGNIKFDSPAGQFLKSKGVEKMDFNSYGSRRGNDQVMVRGTFANIRIKNEMLDNVEGGYTKHFPSGEVMSIYDASVRYLSEKKDLVVIAGKEYGTGSSRDWAAKGTRLQGVKAVLAESFERIHRSNLIGMGVLPIEFEKGSNKKSLALIGDELISIAGLNQIKPGQLMPVQITYADGKKTTVNGVCRIDTDTELEYFENDGILHFVLRQLSS